MALNVSKVVPNSPIVAKSVNATRSQRVLLAFVHHPKKCSSTEQLHGLYCTKTLTFVSSRRSSTLCFLGKSQDTETKPHEDFLDLPK